MAKKYYDYHVVQRFEGEGELDTWVTASSIAHVKQQIAESAEARAAEIIKIERGPYHHSE